MMRYLQSIRVNTVTKWMWKYLLKKNSSYDKYFCWWRFCGGSLILKEEQHLTYMAGFTVVKATLCTTWVALESAAPHHPNTVPYGLKQLSHMCLLYKSIVRLGAPPYLLRPSYVLNTCTPQRWMSLGKCRLSLAAWHSNEQDIQSKGVASVQPAEGSEGSQRSGFEKQ